MVNNAGRGMRRGSALAGQAAGCWCRGSMMACQAASRRSSKSAKRAIGVVQDGPDAPVPELVQDIAVPQLHVAGRLGRQDAIGAHDGAPGGAMARSRVSGTIVPALMCGAALLTAARPAASRMPRR
jgi:hypothetical protein